MMQKKKIHYYIDVTYETKGITFRTQERKTRNAVNKPLDFL